MSPAARTPGRREPGPLSGTYRGVTIAVVTLETIIAFETMAISTVMPALAADLRPGAAYGLIASAMFTAQLVGIVAAGAWIAHRGSWTPALAGQALFAAGSLAAGLAPTFAVLLLGRVVAGLGSGLLFVAIYVVIGRVYPASVRPRLFAVMSAAWVLPSIAGPLVAGVLTSLLSWRATFLVVVPAVVVGLAGLARRRSDLTGGEAPAGEAETGRRTLRLGLGVAAGAGLLQWSGTQLVPPRLLPFAAAAAGLVLLGLSLPALLPAGTWRAGRGLPSVMLARFAAMASFAGALPFLPLLLTRHRGLSVAEAGFVLALGAIGWAVGAWVQGRPEVVARGPELVQVGAACAAASGAGYVVTVLAGLPTWWIVAACGLSGVGMGLGHAALSVLMLELAPPGGQARASTALQLSDVLGSTIGMSVTSTLYASFAAGSGSAAPYALLWSATALTALVGVPAGARARRP